MLNIFADQHIYQLKRFLPETVNLTLYDPQQPLTVPPGTNAMLIRTTINLTPNTNLQLPSTLKFVGTASAGTDHVDIPWLTDQSITFTNAAGCNARAVGEYVTTALLIWAHRQEIDLQNLNIGIIGVGHTGGEVRQLLERLGVSVVLYDPPRAKRDSSFTSASRSNILDCDILTFHTPLTSNGQYPTRHWLDKQKLAGRHFKLIINASRGPIIDENALFNAYQTNQVEDYIFDVWEQEPVFTDQIAKSAFIHTPHIAGYSVQAKTNATRMVTEPLCDFFDLEATPNSSPSQRPRVHPPENIDTLPELLAFLHPIDDYHQKFTAFIGEPTRKKGHAFQKLRTEHPLRDEYSSITLEEDIGVKFPAFVDVFRQDGGG